MGFQAQTCYDWQIITGNYQINISDHENNSLSLSIGLLSRTIFMSNTFNIDSKLDLRNIDFIHQVSWFGSPANILSMHSLINCDHGSYWAAVFHMVFCWFNHGKDCSQHHRSQTDTIT